MSLSLVSAWVGHGLAWTAGLFFAFGPVYQGESTEPNGYVWPGSSSSSSLVAVNGLFVVLLLLVPITLTSIQLIAIHLTNKRRMMRNVLVWSPPVVLLGFCFVAIASIGIFYMLSGVALLVAALADMGTQTAEG